MSFSSEYFAIREQQKKRAQQNAQTGNSRKSDTINNLSMNGRLDKWIPDENDLAPVRVVTRAKPKGTEDIAPVRHSLFDDGYDFGDITKTILRSREAKEQETSSFDDALRKKYSLMTSEQLDKAYKDIESAEKKFKDANGGKFINYLAKAGSYIAEGKSGQSGVSIRDKSQSNIDKINDFTREKEIINIFKAERDTEALLGGLSAEQLQLLDNISTADTVEDIAPINNALVAAQGGNAQAFYDATANERNIGKSSRADLFAQLKEKHPEKSDDELNEDIKKMVELRKRQVNAEEQKNRDDEFKDYASENAVASALLSRGANVLGGMTGLTELYLQRDNEYGYDTNAAGFSLTNASNAIDEQVQLDHDWNIEVAGSEVDAFDFLYNAGTGIVDNLGRLALSGGNITTSSAMMFAQSTTQTIIDSKEKGYSDAKALTMGLLNGTFEAVSEKISLEIILGDGGGALKKIAKAFAAEGGEELTSNWLNRIADEIANGNHSELSKMYDSYISKGYTESQALTEVICSVIGEDFETFLIGGLSGAFMGGGNAAVQAVSGKKSTQSEKDIVNKLVEERVTEATKQQAIENAVNKAIEEREAKRGGRFSEENKKALRETITAQIDNGEIDISSEELSKEDVAKIKKEVKDSLKNNDVDIAKIEELLTAEETKQINELKEALENTKDEQEKAEIEGKIKQLEGSRAESLKKQARENKYLAKAAHEKFLSSQKYEYDDSKVADDYEKGVRESAKEFVNNSTKTRKWVDTLAKLAKDRQQRIVLTNNQELAEQGELVERTDITPEEKAQIKNLEKQLSKAETKESKAKIQAQLYTLKYLDVGGSVVVDDNGVETIILNVDSEQAKYTVLGHETKHTLEKYELNKEFNKILFDYAKNKGDYDTAKSRIEDVYKNRENVDIEGEIAADLTGRYLFEDEKFLDTLLKQKSDSKVQQIVSKIKEIIDDLVIRFKGTEQEKQLREVQKKFIELYNSTDADIVSEKVEGTQHAIDNNQNLVYNANRGERYVRTDEFRNLQAECQGMSDEDIQLYHSGNKQIDEKLRADIARVLRAQINSYRNGLRNENGILKLTGKGNEFNMCKSVDGSLFHDVFEIAQKYLVNGELVDLHTVETTKDGIGYDDCYNYLSEDGLSGFSITPDGDLISVFNSSGKGGFLGAIAPFVKENAKTLDCYNSPLQPLCGMYEKTFGFKTASVMDYNMDYDHDNIAENHNEPKIAFMVNTESDVELRNFTKDEYDEAVEYRNSFINQAGSNESAFSNGENTKYSLSDSRKEKQLDIINKYHPKADWDYQTWITSVDDIKTYAETVDASDYATTPDFTDDDVAKALKTGKVKVYSSHDIRYGTFVTPSYMEAKNYAGQGKVNSMMVNLTDVAWIDSLQGQYAPVESDTSHSLAKHGENTDYSKSLQSVRYNPVEDVAPVREDISPTVSNMEKVEPIKEDVAPVKEVKKQKTPDTAQPTAKILMEEPKTDKEKSQLWSKFKMNFIDKASPFETLALKTGNREVDAKFNSIRYSDSKAQMLIGEGAEGVKSLKDIKEDVEAEGLTESLYEYIYHKHNVDRMSLESEEGPNLERLSEELRKLELDNLEAKQLFAISKEPITGKTNPKRAELIETVRKYLESKGVKNKPVFGSSVTAEMSQQIVDKYESENPKLIKYANEIYNYNNHLRDLLVEGGVISQETADLWQKMYPHYVPVRRLGDEGLNVNVPLDSGRTGVNAPIKKATGGNRDILPLFDTMAQRTLQTYKAIAKNRFGIELKNTLGTTVESSNSNLDEAIDSIDTQEELLQKGKNGRNPTFTVFENGKKVTFEITDEMYDAMKPTSEGFAKTIKPLNKASNYMRGVLTEYNPTFMLTNAIKDAQDVLMNSQHAAKTYANFPKAVKELASKGKWFTEYMQNGGGDNTYFDKQTNAFDEEESGVLSKIIGMPLGKISEANNFIERIPRLAEYIASRESGRSVDVSMLDAARVTTNFAAGGDVTKFLNRNGATFLNASVQGAAQQVRNIREAKANGLKGWVQLATKVAIAGLPGMLLNGLLWDDDEEYEELSDYVKENYYIVAKTEDGNFVRIPKGRALAVIQNALTQVQNALTGDDEVDLQSFLDLAVSNLAPNNPIDNNIIAPIAQVIENKTWYGEDLVPTRLQDLPDAEQYDESTDALSKWLGETLNVSPYKINYLLNQYSGGVGDILLPMLTPEAESGEGSFLLAPLKDKFTTDSVLNNQNSTDFYNMSDELTKNANSKNATDEDILKNKYFSSVSADIGDLYTEKRKIQNSNLSDKEKFKQAREIQKQINKIAEEALRNVSETEDAIAAPFYGKGNIDLNNRPVVKNEDGTISTVRGMSINEDGKEILIPTVVNGKIVSDEEAIEHYHKTGEYLGKFDTVEEANAYANKLHLEQEKFYQNKGSGLKMSDGYATIGGLHYRTNDDGEWQKITGEQLEKQNKVTNGLGITPSEYWKNKSEYDFAYEKPEKYAVAKSVGGYNVYKKCSGELYDIKADKDENGKSISGSRKKKVLEYINGLAIDYGAKCILVKSEYSSIDYYNDDILEYLNGRRDISAEDKKTILKELGATVDSEGYVHWN